jgi:pyridinium-3,5-biscarboxylic acid mononucleotide synthase
VAPRPRRPSQTSELRVGSDFRYDSGRARRIGAPEVILGEGKSPDQLLRVLHALHAKGHGALVSRPTVAQRRRLSAARRQGLPLRLLAGGRIARLEGPISDTLDRGPVALVAAGTSDAPIAEEARHVLESVGVEVVTAYDVGVAGLHRLHRALRVLEKKGPRVYLVFAGREGALPTVVAGLVPAPVVGVPVSTGYGRGGRGEAALGAMLQSCAPIAVVNIDGGVPAALFALQLLAGSRRSRGAREG